MNNRFLILDAPQHLHDELLVRWVEQISERYEKMSAFGAIYYPWLCAGEDVFPPSSVMAGVYVAVENCIPQSVCNGHLLIFPCVVVRTLRLN